MGISRSPNLGKLSDPRVRAALFYAKKRRLARLRAQQSEPEPEPSPEPNLIFSTDPYTPPLGNNVNLILT